MPELAGGEGSCAAACCDRTGARAASSDRIATRYSEVRLMGRSSPRASFFSLAPLLRGEGRGEGPLHRFGLVESPLTRIAQMRDPTSPRRRGEVKGSSRRLLHPAAEVQRVGVAAIDIAGVVDRDGFEPV